MCWTPAAQRIEEHPRKANADRTERRSPPHWRPAALAIRPASCCCPERAVGPKEGGPTSHSVTGRGGTVRSRTGVRRIHLEPVSATRPSPTRKRCHGGRDPRNPSDQTFALPLNKTTLCIAAFTFRATVAFRNNNHVESPPIRPARTTAYCGHHRGYISHRGYIPRTASRPR